VFFTGPIWLSILLPIFFAPLLLIVSLVVPPQRGAGFDKSVFLCFAGFALALLTGGALFASLSPGSCSSRTGSHSPSSVPPAAGSWRGS
jgi:hypothetical protein